MSRRTNKPRPCIRCGQRQTRSDTRVCWECRPAPAVRRDGGVRPRRRPRQPDNPRGAAVGACPRRCGTAMTAQQHGPIVAGTAVILTGESLEAALQAVLIAARARTRNGLPNSATHLALAKALTAAMSANGHSGRPRTRTSCNIIRKQEPPTVTVAEAARQLGLSERQTRRLAPKLGGKKIGGRVAPRPGRHRRTQGRPEVDRDNVIQYLASHDRRRVPPDRSPSANPRRDAHHRRTGSPPRKNEATFTRPSRSSGRSTCTSEPTEQHGRTHPMTSTTTDKVSPQDALAAAEPRLQIDPGRSRRGTRRGIATGTRRRRSCSGSSHR